VEAVVVLPRVTSTNGEESAAQLPKPTTIHWSAGPVVRWEELLATSIVNGQESNSTKELDGVTNGQPFSYEQVHQFF
jgi:hypothetical protein